MVFDHETNTPGDCYWTTSRLKLMHSLYIKHDELVMRKRTPVDGLFGSLQYKVAWLIRERQG